MVIDSVKYDLDPLTVSYCRLLDADSNDKPEIRMARCKSTSAQQSQAPDLEARTQSPCRAPQFRDCSVRVHDKQAQHWWHQFFWYDGPYHPPNTTQIVPRWDNPPRATYMREGQQMYENVELQQHWGWELGKAYEQEIKALVWQRLQQRLHILRHQSTTPSPLSNLQPASYPQHRLQPQQCDPDSPTPAPRTGRNQIIPVKPPQTTAGPTTGLTTSQPDKDANNTGEIGTIHQKVLAATRKIRAGMQESHSATKRRSDDHQDVDTPPKKRQAVHLEARTSSKKRRVDPDFEIYRSTTSSEPDNETDEDYQPSEEVKKKIKKRVSQFSRRTSQALSGIGMDGAGEHEEFPSLLMVR